MVWFVYGFTTSQHFFYSKIVMNTLLPFKILNQYSRELKCLTKGYIMADVVGIKYQTLDHFGPVS